MSSSSPAGNVPDNMPETTSTLPETDNLSATPQPATEPQPSYVKLAMRNMVRKRGKSLYHFALTTIGLLTILIGLAYLTR